MFGLPLAFGAPLVLFALLALPIIWYLLRLTPPKPQQEIFPPTRILATLLKREETPAQSPYSNSNSTSENKRNWRKTIRANHKI